MIRRPTLLSSAAAFALASSALSAHAQPCGAGQRMRYSQLREMGFSFSMSTDLDRVDRVTSNWSGGLSGQAIHGGMSPGGTCTDDCHCYYADRGDGVPIADAWDKTAVVPAVPPSSNDPASYGGVSSLPAFSNATVTESRGTLSAAASSVTYFGDGTTTDITDISGSDESCWGGCGGPYYVDGASGCVIAKQTHQISLNAAPSNGHLHLDVSVSGAAGYGHADATWWFPGCAPVKCTCVGTPAPLSASTKVSLTVAVYKRAFDAQRNPIPGTLIQASSYAGTISTDPTSFTELSGIFAQPDGFTITEQTYVPTFYDFGHGPELIAQEWTGLGAVHASIPVDLTIKSDCIILISYAITCGTGC